MKYQAIKFTLLLYILFLVSCQSPLEHLEQALVIAGNNRPELEKVLHHYQQNESDSLKLKAAIFLIENMPGHQSLGGPYIDNYYKDMDSILSNHSIPDRLKLVQATSLKYDSLLTIEEDIKVINADYLISNIDSAFHVWQEKSWAKHVEFSDFCEYILPYKATEYQPMENWREKFYGKFEDFTRITRHCPRYQYSSYLVCGSVNMSLRNLGIQLGALNLSTPLLHPSLLVKLPVGSCTEYALIGVSVMRSKGIPVAFDFTPQWPFQAQGHSWNVVLANNGKNVVFTGAESDPGTPHKAEDKMAKVFRKTYAINRELQRLNKEEKYVPSTFQSYFIKDVTSEYMKTYDVEVRVLPALKQNCQYAYLAVFDNKEWVPIHWAKIKKGKAIFKNMGKEVVYMPVYYTKEGIKPMSHPFLLDHKGKVQLLNADTTHTQTICLNRKYPTSMAAFFAGERMIGGKLQVSNYEDFRDSLTLHQIPDWCSSGRFTNIPDSAWRYWRYLSPEVGLCNISELVFFEKDSIQPIKGKIIGTEGSCYCDPSHLKETVFDGDPLTFFDAPTWGGSWVGMDFGEKVKLGKIIYIPRTDGNMIQLEDTYKLYWWNINGWQQLGNDKVAKDIVLEYTKAPSNALFWLRDISRGKEERIFTYQDGKQVFW